ncbi:MULTISPECIES: hypothetical protein [Pseudomonas]|uniref:hypothetical protein n=1 Tax=Pseudomonas TaxID=286 RepID=UPI0008637D47|nr:MULTISPECIES: hypothetical protein [Pseudomonas]MDD1989900.1 hypothetical protein [Pseudomonas putida]MDG9892125.1 hypothetical protein [Pseudomonas juntendi]QOH70663.1 hypothetical protein IGB31_24515 [Pseudomonas putida]RFQ03465.1 hypothetical protein D0O09_09555 [Pseudomonas putida]HDS1796967.1 hypothetical protein [Pseudomonas putida]
MTNVNEDFISKYPLLFAQSEVNPLGVPYWGIECGAGWHLILEKLCRQVQSHVDNQKVEQVVFRQIKEKYGALRVYYSGGDDYVEGLVDMIEAVSTVICESCSAPAKLTKLKGGWIKTVCEKCRQKFESQID